MIGALSVRAAGSNSFSEQDLRLLELVGERVALAIGQARLREREQHLAQTLQQSLLPESLPEVPGFVVAAHYHPHTASVGGDFYDAIALDGGRLGLAIGDVTGKGLRAAAAMGRLRSGLYAYALEGAPPAQVLTRLGRLAEADGALATAQYLIVEPDSGRGRDRQRRPSPTAAAQWWRPPPTSTSPKPSRQRSVSATRTAARPDSSSPPGTRCCSTPTASSSAPATSTAACATLPPPPGACPTMGHSALCEQLLAALAPLARYRDDVAILAVSRH